VSALTTFAAVVAALVAAPTADAVLGGSNAPKGSAAGTVRVDLPEDVCSGSVVAPRLVLTALHCVQGPQGDGQADDVARDATATVGNPNLGGPLQERPVVGAIVAPQTTPPPPITRQVDAVLLILDRPVAAAPVPLAPPADAVSALRTGPLLLTGFGATSSPGLKADGTARAPTASKHLKHASMTVTGCPGSGASTDLQACAGPAAAGTPDAPSGTACSGDSGAPVTATGADGRVRQVAVLSGATGPDLCSPSNAIVLTPVSAAISGWVAAAATGTSLPPGGAKPSRCRRLDRSETRAERSLGRARRALRRRRSRSSRHRVTRAERHLEHVRREVHLLC
jgi:hypothetical protein